MNLGVPPFVLIIIVIVMVSWVITTQIRAKHGYPLTDDWGNPVHPIKNGDDETTRLLKAENQTLKDNVNRLEERLKVLERIATDPSKRLADDIDNLR